jgi:hypothetical protein
VSLFLTVLTLICSLTAFVAYVIILVAAFKDEFIKGVFCLACGIYAVYYVTVENPVLQYPVGVVWVAATIAAVVFVRLALAVR